MQTKNAAKPSIHFTLNPIPVDRQQTEQALLTFQAWCVCYLIPYLCVDKFGKYHVLMRGALESLALIVRDALRFPSSGDIRLISRDCGVWPAGDGSAVPSSEGNGLRRASGEGEKQDSQIAHD